MCPFDDDGFGSIPTDSVYSVPQAIDIAAAELAAAQHGVISTEQLVSLGVPETTVVVRARPGGDYQRVLPGVFRLGACAPSAAGQASAALLYAGDPAAVVTGLAALHLYGVSTADRIASQFSSEIDIRLHVLVPHHVRRESHSYVRIERTRYLPAAATARGVPVAPVARAWIDAGRCICDIGVLRPLVAEVLSRGLVAASCLSETAATMPVRGSVAIRQAVDEVSLGVCDDSVEALRDAVIHEQLPLPHFLPTLLDRRGCFLARVHGYRAPEGVAFVLTDDICAIDIEGSPARLDDLRRTGVLVINVTTAQLRDEPTVALGPYRAALIESRGRPRPELRILRPAGGIGSRANAGVV